MRRKQTKTSSSGQITCGITLKTLALRTVAFVRDQLPNWRDDSARPDQQAETKLNLQLCKFLDSRARNDFPMVRFDHQEYQSGRRSADLSASLVHSTLVEARLYTIYHPILVLEGKRLPAPSSDREKEYVTGSELKSGGIQRFKLGLHGVELNLVAMIGYVQARTPPYWQKKINKWIVQLAIGSLQDGCVWTVQETLEPVAADIAKGILSYRSLHDRISGNRIEIHHLWIVMN
jgi:hypothetical protein